MTIMPYLSKMRRFRGRDEAVELVGDRGNLTDLLQNSQAHSRDEIVKSVMSCYSGTSYGDSNWQKVIHAWGDSPERITIHGNFAAQYPHLAQLNLDPGLITHLPEFMEFLEYNGSESLDYLAMREKFRQSLGNKTIWRGIVMNEEEAEKARDSGIESDYLRKKGEIPSLIEDFEANVLSVRFDELVERHFHGENYFSPLISVSPHKDVAIAVGRHFGARSLLNKSKKLYLFKINVPEVDLIYYSEHAVRAPGKLQETIKNGICINIAVDGCMNSFPWDRETESYALYKIDPREIVEISKPDVKTSSWNSKVTTTE